MWRFLENGDFCGKILANFFVIFFGKNSNQ